MKRWKWRRDESGWRRGWRAKILFQKNSNLWKIVEEQKELTKGDGEVEEEKEEKKTRGYSSSFFKWWWWHIGQYMSFGILGTP